VDAELRGEILSFSFNASATEPFVVQRGRTNRAMVLIAPVLHSRNAVECALTKFLHPRGIGFGSDRTALKRWGEKEKEDRPAIGEK